RFSSRLDPNGSRRPFFRAVWIPTARGGRFFEPFGSQRLAGTLFSSRLDPNGSRRSFFEPFGSQRLAADRLSSRLDRNRSSHHRFSSRWIQTPRWFSLQRQPPGRSGGSFSRVASIPRAPRPSRAAR